MQPQPNTESLPPTRNGDFRYREGHHQPRGPEFRTLACKKAEFKTMNPKIVIRDEAHDDVRAITEVTIAAFKTLAISRHTEQFIIEALRAAKALTISLVAETDGRVIGHIAFSPATMSDGTPDWYGLGPVSVFPEHQRKGIGKALINEGLSRLKAMKAQGCCLVGHPDYYQQFGFRNAAGLGLKGVPPEVFFALPFNGPVPQGTVAFHAAFKADGPPTDAGDTLPRA
jgi:putative acetyltransferase